MPNLIKNYADLKIKCEEKNLYVKLLICNDPGITEYQGVWYRIERVTMSSINISNATSGEKEVFFIDEDQALFETRGKLITIYRPVIRALNETEQVRLDMLQINPASGSHYLKDGFGYLVTHRLTRKKFFDRKEMKIYDYNKKGDVIYQLLVEKREVM